MDQRITSIVETIHELKDDNTVPRNIKARLDSIILMLNDSCELSIKINKVLNELDEIADDTNMQSYTRTQIWNIVSVLETIR